MSSNQITFGYMGALKEPIRNEAEREAVGELLSNYGLGINYEGTLIYDISRTHDMDYGEGFGIHVLSGGDRRDQFHDDVWKAGFALDMASIRPFVDLWYNGADSTHSMLTLEEFMKLSAEDS